LVLAARRYVREQVQSLPPFEEDPLWDFVGKSEGRPADAASVDASFNPR
jgi:hypothetical protein